MIFATDFGAFFLFRGDDTWRNGFVNVQNVILRI